MTQKKQNLLAWLLVGFFLFLLVVFLNRTSHFPSMPTGQEKKQEQRPSMKNFPTSPRTDIKRSEKGCNKTDGFIWQEELQVCVQQDLVVQEESLPAISALKDYFGNQVVLNIESISKRECEGCFFVSVEFGGSRAQVDLTDYKVRSLRPIF